MTQQRQREDYYTRKEVAERLGVHYKHLVRYTQKGLIAPDAIVLGRNYYLKSKIDLLVAQQFAPGDNYGDIARRFGVALNTVKKQFKRLAVQPTGYNRARTCVVFDRELVDDVALSLGWLENPTNGSSSHDSAK